MVEDTIETEPVNTDLPNLDITPQETQEDNFTMPNFAGELVNVVLSMYTHFRPQVDRDLFLLTEEEKEIVSKLLNPILLKLARSLGMKASDFEVAISVIVVFVPRVITIVRVEQQLANSKKLEKQVQANKVGE